MIVDKILDFKKSLIRQYPVNANRASEVGHPCVKYHVLNRTAWQEKSLHDVGLQLVFDLGNMVEKQVIQDMVDAGFDVVEQQRSFLWGKYNITGHIDGKVIIDGQTYPFEIKSCSPYVFDSINTIDDLKNGKYLYLRKYPSQLNLYLLMDEKEKGFFLFKNKVSGAMKEIWMDLDLELAERDIQRMVEVNNHIKSETLPDGINEEDICTGCPFEHICAPAINREEVEIDTSELADLLNRLEQLKPMKKEYEDIDRQIKPMLEGREKVLAGDWYISGGWVTRKETHIPESTYWKRNIKKI